MLCIDFIILYSVFILAIFDSTESNFINDIEHFVERKLNCWLKNSTYAEFEILVSFSTRNMKDQVYSTKNMIESFDPKMFDFNPKRKTAVLVHGFLGKLEENTIKMLSNVLLQWRDMNVIYVDWSKGSSDFFYYELAAANGEFAAITVKQVLLRLKNYWARNNITRDKWGEVHLIGHSLGAHVVGHIGELLITEHFPIDRITGLDPAEPCFEFEGKAPYRLSKGSAAFVDIIHTDSAKKKNAAFGLYEPIGDADFYVNGGGPQADCRILRKIKNLIKPERLADHDGILYPQLISHIISVSKSKVLANYDGAIYQRLIYHILRNGACDHLHSIVYFTDSVKEAITQSCKFQAYPWTFGTEFNFDNRTCGSNDVCTEIGIMAENYKYDQQTVFYVPTNSQKPFCIKN